MTFIRREIRSLGPVWNPTMYWYARAVRAMQAKPVTDRTSWWFLAGIHGFNATVWQQFGIINSGTALPTAAVQQRYWNQCQHQSWYFLPWHRGYLSAFERIVRATIVSLGGPAGWALPYWDYSNTAIPNARQLPDAFAYPVMADGTPNPLFVARRYGRGTWPIVLTPESVQLNTLWNPVYTGGEQAIPPGFGGPPTWFNHGGGANGGLEGMPHNGIHTAIGGSAGSWSDWRNAGLMSRPDTAGLDPIFWLHHANIDRLWTYWLQMPWMFHANPTDPNWLNGPQQPFVMPLPGNTEWVFRPSQMVNSMAQPLDYRYDMLAAGLAPELEMDDASAFHEQPPTEEAAAMAPPQGEPELIGASAKRLAVKGGTKASLTIDADSGGKVMAGFAAAAQLAESAPKPDHVYLKLEGIRAASDAALFHVYVDLPDDAMPSQHPERLAGSVSLFGVSAASDPDGKHGGNGIDQVFDITRIVAGIGLRGDALDKLKVRFVPDSPLENAAEFTVERLSVFRLGA